MALRFPSWASRVALIVIGVVALAWVITGWMHSNAIREELLTPNSAHWDYPLTVMADPAGRIVVERTADSIREGIWGLASDDSYAQVSTIVSIDDTSVERGVQPLEGALEVGDPVRLDPDAYFGDPTVAHGLGFEEPRSPSDIGPHPTWFIDGRRSTWVIFVHGRGTDRLSESLRVIPSLV